MKPLRFTDIITMKVDKEKHSPSHQR